MSTSGSGVSRQSVIAWCATCRSQPAGRPDEWLVGTRYRCRHAKLDEFHVAAVVPADMKPWLNAHAALVRFSRSRRHPRNWTRIAGKAGRYGALLFGSLVGALWLASLGSFFASVGALVAVAIILDLLAYNTMVAFITQHPQVPMRNAFYGIAAFALLALGFAVFYAGMPAGSFTAHLDVYTAVYFSFVTIATLGYGDIAPTTGGTRLLVVCELLTGLFYLVVLLATMVGWVNSPATLKTEHEISSGEVAG